ncbi:MAG TPA: hypothetical protein VH482_14855 [Thermomicrobiales bacterium]
MSFSVVNAAPKMEIFVVWAGYGTIQGIRIIPRGRMWVIAESAEPDAPLTCRLAWNEARTGRVLYEDLGPVPVVRLRTGKWAEAIMPDGRRVQQTLASCVCGAGAVGYAGPMEGRHFVTQLNARSHERVEVFA